MVLTLLHDHFEDICGWKIFVDGKTAPEVTSYHPQPLLIDPKM